MSDLEELLVPDAAAWRAWLESHHADRPGVWLVLHKKGGQTTKQRHGPGFYSEIGRKGGEVVRRERGPEFFSEIGRKGGQKVRELIERGKRSNR